MEEYIYQWIIGVMTILLFIGAIAIFKKGKKVNAPTIAPTSPMEIKIICTKLRGDLRNEHKKLISTLKDVDALLLYLAR